ncbi:MAG: 50S ribosomal protein L34e [Candidatus Diapherotrites archaeon]|nr:50S ribosomal protein L34e [Candidatus Diapherotrites archaeon]
MVQRFLRTRSKKKVQKRASKETRLKFKAKKVSPAHCAACSGILAGVPRKDKAELKKLAKTKRRPQVPFGGHLCASCRKTVFEEAAMVSSGTKEIESVRYKLLPYVETVLKKL